jgi:hypothetical protein
LKDSIDGFADEDFEFLSAFFRARPAVNLSHTQLAKILEIKKFS